MKYYVSIIIFLLFTLLVSCSNQKKESYYKESSRFNLLPDDSYVSNVIVVGDINNLNSEVEVKCKSLSFKNDINFFVKKEGGFVVQSFSKKESYIIGIRKVDGEYKGFYIKGNYNFPGYKKLRDDSKIVTNLNIDQFNLAFPKYKGEYFYETIDTIKLDLSFYEKLYKDSLLVLKIY